MNRQEEIAIIGVGCRFPGATCLREFWDVLVKGENHVGDIPPERWDVNLFSDPDMEAVGKSFTRKGGFIKDYAHFDNELFGINENEAIQMDPQQRHVLECTYMALENAGIPRENISGQKVGVFIGAMNSDFTVRMTSHPHQIGNYSVSGLAGSVIANRVSYVFNLSGPSMVVDTACSSSLVAIHQACLSLRAGECQMAVCGGVNLMLHPTVNVPLSKARMLSPTGQCHAFSADADGYVRGEGCGIVILKTLKQALKDNDNIWATIRTGINQDGRAAKPITAPSGSQQKQLIEEVLSSGGVDPNSIDYIEAHGTGTRLGDPIEINTFGEFFSERGQHRKRYLGSVKTNIGHLEPAAGIAGLIKVLLMMKNNTIVPSLHFKEPNELIDFDRYGFIVPTENVEWLSDHKIACLNSFGFGGTNSHAVVESYQQNASTFQNLDHSVVCFSGRSTKHLNNILQSFYKNVSDGVITDLGDLSYTSTVRREHFKFRKAFVVSSLYDLKKQILAYLENSQTKKHKPNLDPKLIFVFCGMGTAWPGMCVRLMNKFNVVRSELETIDDLLHKYVPWSLVRRLTDGFDVHDPVFGPIAIFACQVALAKLWISVGVSPSVVVGQSVGEVAAAHCAGILSLEDAVKVIYHRTEVLARATGGKMLLVQNTPVSVVQDVCAKMDGVTVALYYSPTSCTISGDSSSVDLIKSKLAAMKDKHPDIHMKQLKVTTAFHSYHVDPCGKELNVILKGLKSKPSSVEMISCSTPELNDDICSSSYWGKSLRSPVFFADAIRHLGSRLYRNVFIEVGPNPVLGPHLSDIFCHSDVQGMALQSLSANTKIDHFLTSVSVLYSLNIGIKWEMLYPSASKTIDVPCYSFLHKPLLLLPEVTEDEVFGPQLNPWDHLFVREGHESFTFFMNITPFNIQTLYEHKVRDIIVIPGATYAETAFGIAKALMFENVRKIKVTVSFFTPVTLKKDTAVNLLTHVNKQGDEYSFSIRKDDVLHAQGTFQETSEHFDEERLDLDGIKGRCKESMSGNKIYQRLKQCGFTYGENFATIEYGQIGKGEYLTKLKLGTKLQKEMKRTVIHPAVLDGMLQSAAVSAFTDKEFLPIELKNVEVRRALQYDMYVYTQIVHSTESLASFKISLLADNGVIIATVDEFSVKFLGYDSFDERTATFKSELVRIDAKPTGGEHFGKDAVVFTNLDLERLQLDWIVHEVNHRKVSEMRHNLDKVIRHVPLICFVFPVPGFESVAGEDIQQELTDRLLALRLVVMYLANKGPYVPLLVIFEDRAISSSQGDVCIAYCLNQAIKSFVRCCLREYRQLEIQLIDAKVISTHDLIDMLPAVLSVARCEKVKCYPEIKFDSGDILVHAVMAHQVPTPLHRQMSVDDHKETVVASKDEGKISSLMYTPSELKHQRHKNTTDILVSSVALHTASLHSITIDGISETKECSFPVVCFEVTGTTLAKGNRESQSDVVVLYPSLVSKMISVPKSCLMTRDKIPWHKPGYLLKLYVLYLMCTNVSSRHVMVLHSSRTLAYAQVLARISELKGAKQTTMRSTDDLLNVPGDQNSDVLISTVTVTKEIVQLLFKQFPKLQTMTVFAKLSNFQVLDSVRWTNPSLRLHVIKNKDIFFPKFMQTVLPKFSHWIKSHQKSLSKLSVLLNECTNSHACKMNMPINIGEILYTKEMNVSSELTSSMMVTCGSMFKRSGTYLIVGGLTGLGWECVTYLSFRGAGRIVIICRSKPSAEKQNDIDNMSTISGCKIISMQGDVTQQSSLEHALSSIGKLKPYKPVKGIFYGAAVLADATLSELTKTKMQTVLGPKVTGLWNLHLLTIDLSLDFFVMHSSGAAVLGNAGQANYGAGNGFMDGLSHCRREAGLSAQSINWGPLDLGLLENKGSVLKKLEDQGYVTIQRKYIAQCLTHILMLNEPQALICRINKQKMAQQLQRDKETTLMIRLKDYLEPVMKALDLQESTKKVHFHIDEITRLTAEKAVAVLKDYLISIVCDKALLDESAFDPSANMKDQGVDSMYAMEITSEILSQTNIKMSVHEIQLQSAQETAHLLLNRLNDEQTSKMNIKPERNKVKKQTIMTSLWKSICGFEPQNTCSVGLTIISTINVPDLVSVQLLKDVARECLARHPSARTSFIISGDQITTKELSLSEALDFRVISGSNEVDVKVRTDDQIQLEQHVSLRFIFLEKKSKLRMVFHKFVFDLKSITTLVKEIQSLAEAQMQGLSMDTVKSEEDNDVCEEIQKVLDLKFDESKEFWRLKLQDIPQNSFQGTYEGHRESLDCDDILVSRTLDKSWYLRLATFAKDHQLTCFEILVSIYQFLLAVTSSKSESVTAISVDLRSFVPSLARSVGRCTNCIPLVCRLPPDSTRISDFLRYSKAEVEQFLQNSILPSEEIEQIVPEEVSILRRNYFIHEYDIITHQSNNLIIEMPVTFSEHMETVFYLWQRKATETFELKFHARKNLLSQNRAEAILNAFTGLLSDVLDNPSVALGELKTRSHRRLESVKSMKKRSSVCVAM